MLFQNAKYATFNEYEETQNSLLGVSTTFKSNKFKVTPV